MMIHPSGTDAVLIEEDGRHGPRPTDCRATPWLSDRAQGRPADAWGRREPPSVQDIASLARMLRRIDALLGAHHAAGPAPYVLSLQEVGRVFFSCRARVLRSLLHHLVTRAITDFRQDRSVPGGGERIDVTVALHDDWVVLQIADNGPGLALPALADLDAEPGGRLRWTGDAGAALAGAIAAAIALGGGLYLMQSAPSGTRFVASFPCSPPPTR